MNKSVLLAPPRASSTEVALFCVLLLPPPPRCCLAPVPVPPPSGPSDSGSMTEDWMSCSTRAVIIWILPPLLTSLYGRRLRFEWGNRSNEVRMSDTMLFRWWTYFSF
uniref:Putative secreted peptide n=1 Tax=Anopheles braziliensis TaxID=58242 RepID=A0A2M3ZRT0_9DIPT